MHTMEVGSANVPAFLTKLWKLVEDPKCDNLIRWGPSGETFIIQNTVEFAKELLPLYFKHNHMASFIRQLNMYGFRKVLNIEQGGLRSDKDEVEFHHPWFLKGHEKFLEQIKRKMPTGKSDEPSRSTEVVNVVMNDVKSLRGKQESMDAKLVGMKRENEALWREIANLRQKHIQQQQIVNKLIQFLVSLVQQNRGIAVKRKIPLMFDSRHDNKTPRRARSYTFDSDKSEGSASSPLSGGPVIHDITDTVDMESELLADDVPSITKPVETLLNETLTADDNPIAFVGPSCSTAAAGDDPVAIATSDEVIIPDEESRLSPSVKIESPQTPSVPVTSEPDLNTLDPVMSEFSSDQDLMALLTEPRNFVKNASVETVDVNDILETVMGDMAAGTEPETSTADQSDPTMDIALPSSSDNAFTRNDFNDHLETMQSELDTLRELLSTSGVSINAATLLELFNQDDPMPSGGLTTQGEDKNEISGTELIQYNPSLLELTEEDSEFFDPTTDGSSLFENVETILPDEISGLVTPDVSTQLSSPFLSSTATTTAPGTLTTITTTTGETPSTAATSASLSRKRGRPKKS